MVNVRRDASVAGQVASRVAHSGTRAWSAADFPELAATAVSAALRRLAKDGELRPVRHGLYWRGPKYRFGMELPEPILIAKALTCADGVGWAGLSASNVLGLTTQVPAVEIIAVPTPAPRPIKGIKFVARPGKRRRLAAKLTPIEVAALEVLTNWTDVIDVPPADAVLSLAARFVDGSIRPDRVAMAAAGEEGPTRDRLRVVLSAAGRDDLAADIRGSSTAEVTRRALAGV